MNLLPKNFSLNLTVCAVVFQGNGSGVLLVVAILLLETNRECDFAGDGLQHERISELSSSAQSAVWSSRKPVKSVAAACRVFVPSGVLVMGIDDTIERRRGKELPPRVSIVTQFVQ